MEDASNRSKALNAMLAPYATSHESTLGRVYPENPDATRTPFQRDRDRIIHCQAFRRLQGKTQVFVAGEGDHFRTRLTHTMEVAQISRDAARTLALNEDLAECVALAHDLGHPPFGHTGEGALDDWMQRHNGHFEHNEQSLRIVSVLEQHSALYPGLNLSREVLEGLKKHDEDANVPIEARIVDLADEIAYTAHDCDDGLRADVFSRKELTDVPLAAHAWERTRERGTALRGAIIEVLLGDLYAHFDPTTSIRDIDFSETVRSELQGLRRFLAERLYTHPRVVAATAKGKRIITLLCDHYLTNPDPRIKDLQERTGGTIEEAIKDYVAGMTDGFARLQAAKAAQENA